MATLEVDVAVVGAGVAGLAVARGLQEAGRHVVVLEARDRVGGRLLSKAGEGARGEGPPLDLGATWFWPNEPRVRALIAALGLPTHRQHRVGDAVYEDPRGVQRLVGNPLDVESGRFSRGASSLALELAVRLEPGTVRLSTPVRRVRGAGDGVVVEAEGPDGGAVRVEARHAVLALPPALAAHGVEFRPALPSEIARLAAATPVWMGATIKVVVRYARAFWREAGLSGAAVSHVGPLREIHDMSGPEGDPAALFGFAESVSGAEGREPVLRQLVRLFGPEAADPLGLDLVDWSRERWTSPPQSDRSRRFELYGHPLYQEPIHGRIHFASTETAPAFGGHIEGALIAAEAVVARLAPLSSDEPDDGAGDAYRTRTE